jgi:hypothetical protein
LADQGRRLWRAAARTRKIDHPPVFEKNIEPFVNARKSHQFRRRSGIARETPGLAAGEGRRGEQQEGGEGGEAAHFHVVTEQS